MLALAGLTGAAAVLLWPQIRQMYSVPDLGDPLFSIWRIGWVFHKLHGDPRPLFSPNIFYPHELTFTYSDSMLLPALTATPLLFAGLHPVVAYNLATMASFIASGFAMYLLAERLTGSPKAAFVSGLLFGFYPYRFEHYSHFELQMTYCMPLALLALHAFIDTARVRHALTAGLLAAGQLYSSMYYAVFFTLYAGWVVVHSVWLRRAPVRRLIVPALLAGAVAAALAWPLARTYSAARLGGGQREAPHGLDLAALLLAAGAREVLAAAVDDARRVARAGAAEHRDLDRVVEVVLDALAVALGGRAEQPHQQEERHHGRHEVGVRDLPGAAMHGVAALLDALDDDRLELLFCHGQLSLWLSMTLCTACGL